MKSEVALVGDIGGTKTLVALASRDESGRLRIHGETRYESRDHPGLEPIVRDYLARTLGPTAPPPARAAFGLAGPVVGRRWTAPNLPWEIHGPVLEAALGMRAGSILMLNDFLAAGYGIAELGDEDARTLQEGVPEPRGPRAILGAGTGLGQAVLFWGEDGYEARATEGGHGDFAARKEREWRLHRFLRTRHRRVSVERVVSGPGLRAIYDFLLHDEEVPEPAAIRTAMASEDPAAVIASHGLAGSDRTCVEALDMFVSAYGAEAGNLALRAVATGGLWVGGGIAPRILEKMTDGTFMAAFLDKGRLSGYLRNVPVRLIVNLRVGLLGAAARALHAAPTKDCDHG
ncbi:MAG: glucokinase [Deltaproteobacteria bacterium]|nr:glucokinase [Deltaproteobacteria bacterium]